LGGPPTERGGRLSAQYWETRSSGRFTPLPAPLPAPFRAPIRAQV